jgi:hypothetical protein
MEDIIIDNSSQKIYVTNIEDNLHLKLRKKAHIYLSLINYKILLKSTMIMREHK